MSNPVDYCDDTNHQQLYALDHLCGLPEFVKNAELEERPALANLGSESFGDNRRRLYPCHTKAATWLANAFFQQNRSNYSKNDADFVQGRIEKFAGYWGIRNLVDQFNDKWNKIAYFNGHTNLPDEKYALVAEFDGNKIRRFPMPNAASVKAAGEYLYANRALYPYEWRKAAARRILKEAIFYDDLTKQGKYSGPPHPFNGETQDYLERAAGFGIVHPSHAAEKIAQRAVMLHRDFKEHAIKLAELVKVVQAQDVIPPAEFQKIAALIDAVDRETGLFDHYHEGVEMPEEMFFDVLEKEAEDILDSQIRLTSGSVYPVGLLLNLPLEKIAAVLGRDFLKEVVSADGFSVDPVKFAQIVTTLPRDDAEMIDRAIHASIQGPHEKKARAPLMAGESFSKASLIAKLKKEGKKPEESPDFSLCAKL